jgi:hypothetical protein
MKKAQYAIAALGAAPALGLTFPAAPAPNAIPKPSQSLTRSSKKVSVHPIRGMHIDGAIADAASSGGSIGVSSGLGVHKSHCGHNTTSRNRTHKAPYFMESVQYSPEAGGGGCIHYIYGQISKSQTNLDMRIRVYSKPGGHQVFHNYVGGTIRNCLFGCVTEFWSYNSRNYYSKPGHWPQVCVALVNSAYLSSVKYGPNCITLK